MSSPIAPVMRQDPVLQTERTADVHDRHWFPEVFKYMPMGLKRVGQMTSFISMKGQEIQTESRSLTWWEKGWNQRDCPVVDVFDGPGLTNAASGTTAVDTEVNVQMTENNAKKWDAGMMCVIWEFADSAYKQVSGKVKGLVTGKSLNGDSDSYVTVKLLAADSDQALAASYIRMTPAGQKHSDVHTLPEGRFEDLVKREGAMSTFLGSYTVNDYERKEKSRPNYDVLAESEADALKDFLIDKEMAFIESVLDDSDKEYQSTGGLEYYLTTYEEQAGQNYIDALTDTIYLGSTTGPAYTWIKQLLTNVVEYVSRWHDNTEDLPAWAGPEVMLVLEEYMQDRLTFNVDQPTETDEVGIRFNRIKLQNGNIRFYEHPLMKNSSAYRGTMIMPNMELITQATFMPFESIPADVMNSERAKRAKRDGTIWSSNAKGGFRECCGWKFNGISNHVIIRNIHRDLARS